MSTQEFDDEIEVSSQMPISVDLMRRLFGNESFLELNKLDASLRNIRGPANNAGRNKLRDKPAKKLLTNNLVLYSVSEDFLFGSSSPNTTNDITSYRRRKEFGTEYRWPSNVNGYIFSNEHQPVVVMSLLSTPGSLILPNCYLNILRITPKFLEFDLHKSLTDTADPKPAGSERFWVSILALGVKGPYFD